MRVLMLLAFGLCLTAAGPAAAQDDEAARRLVLAEQYLELTQGASLRKTLEGYFEEAFAKSEAPAEQRDWLTENMSAAFDAAMQATFADLTDDVAEIFTVQELEALVAFFDTPMGHSITGKSFELGVRLQAAMAPHLIAAFTQLGEKYCARFECPAAEGGQTGKPAD
ncbi:hypothetical protein [Brevundimonas sp.]|uniref:DUF2059 domain-containing protein n=1 Tax=Brevundimonas sp. TaxID=1871086 RepID=UPI002BBB4092|nr:hypothetical protein [Brevundimonas sp.]HWQ88048.1 hypothetical protein [Brevundimonas sp.]